MADSPGAHDDYERHYTEKIWALVPEIYRHEDGLAEPPDQLRALVKLLAGQAAVQRRSIDRIVADSRIEEADDWAVAYIGQLLGTRLLDPRNTAGRRRDVGHTLVYRRRAGTPRLLERLAREVAGWDAVAQEAIVNLFRFPHALDRTFPVGPVTRTPRGGFPDLRRTRIGDVMGGPFEDMAYRPEFRPGRGTRGRYCIEKVNIFCYRKYAYPLEGITPVQLDATHYTIDPSGRGHVPLFQVGDVDLPECEKPAEWDVRMPITCRRLNTVFYRLPASAQSGGVNWDRLVGRPFESAEALRAATVAAGIAAADLPALFAAALEPDSPKKGLLHSGGRPGPSISLAIGAGNPLALDALYGAGLENWADGANLPAGAVALVDPARGLVQLVSDPTPAGLTVHLVHYGILSPVGAGTHERGDRVPDGSTPPITSTSPDFSNLNGDQRLGNSQTFTPTTAASRINVNADSRLWAVEGTRPFVLLRPGSGGTSIEVRAGVADAKLTLSGIWLGALLRGAASGGTLCELRLTGSFAEVFLEDMTLDPGGLTAAPPGGATEVIPHLRLVIDGQVQRLGVDRCILGSVHDAAGGAASSVACSAAQVTIVDSILLPHATDPVLLIDSADVRIERSTVLGDCQVGRAQISDCIIDGGLEVQDAQNSCLRFSMLRSGGRTPSPYECVVLSEGLPPGSFESVRFGDPGLGVLTPTCPKSVREGAEGEAEMGAFNRALLPIKQADLSAKIAEFAPVQAAVQLVFQT